MKAKTSASTPPSDTAMLDWLDKQGAHYEWKLQLPSDHPNVNHCVFLCRNTTSGYATVREAIAARMADNSAWPK
jgi:hypothetical protein